MSKKNTKAKKYTAIYRTYKDQIYQICLHYLMDEEKAQNMCLQIFLDFYKDYEAVPPEKIKQCLVLIAKKLVNNQ